MRNLPVSFVTLSLVSALAITACTERSPARQSGRADTSAISHAVVCGIDISGSYQIRSVGLEACLREIERAGTGTVNVRWIGESSYRNTAFVGGVDLPPTEDCATNPFDLQCRRRNSLIDQLKAAEIARIRALTPPEAHRTDIMGFFAAAADVLNQAPEDATRRIVLATDGVDNVGYALIDDLTGVDVRFVGFQTDSDPSAVRDLQESWQRLLGELGATVSFHSAEVR